MANEKTAPAPKPESKPAGIKPLVAIHDINPFGKGDYAPSGSIFVPSSEAERAELLAGDFPAARELNDAEAVTYKAKPAAPAAASADDNPLG